MCLQIHKGGGKNYVCGVAWTKDNTVEHILISDLQDLDQLKGSKYLQSNIKNLYTTIISLLEQGNFVFFTGTPCQVAGLRACLKKDYQNLITADLICHGTPSAKVYRKYISELVKSPHEKVIKTNFRDKVNGWTPNLTTTTTTYTADKNEYNTYTFASEKDTYLQAFLSDLCLRKSCSVCPFACLPRQGDITLGDFWGIDRFSAKLNDQKGTSVVLLNNEKGKAFFKKYQRQAKFCEKVPLKYAVKGNTFLIKPNEAHRLREAFFENLDTKSLKENVDICLGKIYDCAILNFWYCSNYGAILTCWALSHVLEKMGKTCRVVNYIPPQYRKSFKGSKSENFAEKYLLLTEPCRNKTELKRLNDQTDTFIAGSDQIWRCPFFWNKGANIFQLNFANTDKKKIAYAASFGTDHFEGDEEAVALTKYYLKKFDNIAVREDDGVDICAKTFDVQAEHVLDPVFLIEKNDWNILLQNALAQNQDHITAYILDQSPKTDEIIRKVKDYFGKAEVISFGDGGATENLSVEDWVYHIKNCKFLITDSFHGVCFAIIFNRPFLCIGNIARGYSRFRSLFKMFGLGKRCILPENQTDVTTILDQKINYDRVNEIWKKEKIRSIEWLKSALEKTKEAKNEDIADLLLDQIEKSKEEIVSYLELPKLRKKYLKYKLLSHLTFGKKRRKYKQKKKILKEKMRLIRARINFRL